MAYKRPDRAKMSVTGAAGTGDITLNVAISGAQTFANAGLLDGDTFSYVIEDGANWELGQGTYHSSVPSFTRTTVYFSSGGGTSKITASASATVYSAIIGEDFFPSRTTKTTSYTMGAADRNLAITAMSGAIALTLPPANTVVPGQIYTVIDESGSCSTTNTITISRAGSDTVNGSTAPQVLNVANSYCRLSCDGVSKWVMLDRSPCLQIFTASGTYTATPGMTSIDTWTVAGGGGGGGGGLQAVATAVSGGAGGGAGGALRYTLQASEVGASQTVTIGAGGTAGVAATTSTTVGGAGGAGGATTLGLLLSLKGGGGGAGGGLAALSGGGGGGGMGIATGGTGTNAAGGTASTGGSAGGAGAVGVTLLSTGGGSGGGGAPATGGAGLAGGYNGFGPTGGGAGGGITNGNTVSVGGIGGQGLSHSGANMLTSGGAAGATGGAGGTGPSAALVLNASGLGGGGGGSSTTAAGSGGLGGLGGGGGGGGGSAQNGGTAGTGGVGGAGIMVIVERFDV